LKPWPVRGEPSHRQERLKRWYAYIPAGVVCPQPRSSPAAVLTAGFIKPTTPLAMKPPSVQSPFAQLWRYLRWEDVHHLLGRRYPSVLAPTGSCAHPVRLSPPSAFRLVRRVFAGCYQPLLPPGCSRRYLRESFLRCLIPYPGGPTQCVYLLLPVCHRPSPLVNRVGFPLPRPNDFPGGSCFEAADISSRSGLPVCSPPRSFLPLLPQGSRGFYFRAEHASLPPHASDMLAIRIQAIDGMGTCTPPDSQPCRLLLTKHDMPGRKNPGCPAAVCAAVGTIWGVSKLGGRNMKKYLQPRKHGPARSRDSRIKAGSRPDLR
jgi:hypothetical protein